MPDTPPAIAIEVRNLDKSFGHRPVLRGLELSVGWGESLTIFGPNGSGKTTLIKLLATLSTANSGQLLIAEMDPSRYGPTVRSILGVVTHQTFLYDDLTAYENLQFYGQLYSLEDISSRIRYMADALKIADRLHQRVRTLSHGMQKRVGIARALLHDPSILLLDEPETGLDPEAVEILGQILARHRAKGGTIVMTTHNVERGLALGDRVAILSGGKIAYQEERRTLDPSTFLATYARFSGGKG